MQNHPKVQFGPTKDLVLEVGQVKYVLKVSEEDFNRAHNGKVIH